MNTLKDLNLEGKKVLVRVDFNVPQDADLNITDTTRIEAAKPTVMHILENGGAVILMSHLGRPKGKVVEEMSLQHIVSKVSDLYGIDVKFAKDIVGDDAKSKVADLQAGEILLLENLRFRAEEEGADENFAKELASFADVYVNDAFGTAHRRHASTAVVAEFFKEKAFGFLMQAELEAIDKVLKNGEKPVLAILGGAKVSSKITIIENILPAIDHLIVGGGMTYTFIKAQGGSIGDSIVENDKLDLALEILEKAKAANVQVHLPLDNVAANDFSNEASSQIVDSKAIPDGWQGLDIGPKSVEEFSKVIKSCKTILWNGPLGVFEFPNFAKGTLAIGEAIGEATAAGSFSLVGGGDSVAAVKQYGMTDKVSYVSTGGGAMLEALEGQVLPGVAAIRDN